MAKISIQTTKTAMPRCYCYTTPTISEHDGWVKIGYTEQDDVEDRIRQQLQTAHIPHHTEWSDIAVFADGRTYFRDSDFHAYLKKQGVERMKPMNGDKKQPEWFRISGDESFTLYSKFRRTKGVLDTVGTIAYELRAEQEQAVSQTFDYFMSHEKGEFLWNAKPRFGKTLATYDLCKRLQSTKGDYACNILIVTNRPAIANSWYEDFVKFIGTESGFRFVSEVSALKGKPFVMSREEYTDSLTKELADCIEFVSLQDLKGSLYFGGQHDKLKELVNMQWELLVIDEAHEALILPRPMWRFIRSSVITPCTCRVLRSRRWQMINSRPMRSITGHTLTNRKQRRAGTMRSAITLMRTSHSSIYSPIRCPRSSVRNYSRALR